MILFKYHVALELLMENRFHEKHPHFFYAYNWISNSCIELYQKIEYLLVGIWILIERNYSFIIHSNLTPYLMSQVISFRFILRIIHVLHLIREDIVVVTLEWVTSWESFINQKVIVKWISPCRQLLSDHLQLFHLLYKPISDTEHELLDIFFKNAKENVWIQLETPFLQSSLHSQ